MADLDEEHPGPALGAIAALSRCVRHIGYLGLPALTIPIGLSARGMPVGMQLIGRPFSDPLLLALAAEYQDATRWHLALPPVQQRLPAAFATS